MRSFVLVVFLISVAIGGYSQAPNSAIVGPSASTGVAAVVDAEKSFARMSDEKGPKAAFLAFLADDGVVFEPLEVNGKLVWKNRPESPAVLSWNPVWADLSSDGNLGYTTGGWEYRPNGMMDTTAFFGEYLSIWQKQADGAFKVLLDIGIDHPGSTLSNAPTRFPSDAGTGAKSAVAGVNDGTMTEIFSNKSLANGYFSHLADDAYVLRDGSNPFVGKAAAFIGLERHDKEFPPSAFLNFNAAMSKIYGNMMYVSGLYQLTLTDKSVKKWNFVQIWKLRAGKWQIVADVFKPVPSPKPVNK